MNLPFENQVGIITGAASGLGRSIALKLSGLKVKLALFDINLEALKKVQSEMENECEIFQVDIIHEEKVQEAIRQVGEQFGRIDILVNSAGVTGATNIKSHEVDSNNLRFVYEVNFFGSFHTSKHVLPWMMKNNYGRILHIASIAGKEGNAGMLAYSSSKAALINMAKVQGKEYAHTGITVNALAPAVIRTAMVDAMPEEQVLYMTDKIPMKRCGSFEEVSDMAVFIVSPGTSFTTGFTFDLSGGRATY